MKEVFLDTCFLVALINPADSLHDAAVTASEASEGCLLIVTEEVLTELLNFYSGYGQKFREAAAQIVKALAKRENVMVIPQSRESFARGFALYSSRPDKSYSATDCSSMATMKERRIDSVLSNDNHFRQEGFGILLEERGR